MTTRELNQKSIRISYLEKPQILQTTIDLSTRAKPPGKLKIFLMIIQIYQHLWNVSKAVFGKSLNFMAFKAYFRNEKLIIIQYQIVKEQRKLKVIK